MAGRISGEGKENEGKTDFYVWGSDKHGQLGQSAHKKLFMAPRACSFKGAERVTQVSCGDSHTMILTSDGLLYGCGSNANGQVGIKGTAELATPTLIEQLVFDQGSSKQPLKIVSVCCGPTYTLATTNAGHAYSWGSSAHGALGLGEVRKTSSRPTLIHILQLNKVAIAKVSAYANHTLLLTASGEVMACGRGHKGQLGQSLKGDKTEVFTPQLVKEQQERFIDIAAGKDFSLFLSEKLEVYACGSNA